MARIRSEAQEKIEVDAQAARKAAEDAAARALEAEVARVQREADEKLAAELARVRRDAEAAQLAAAEAARTAAEQGDASAHAARAAREAAARQALEAELASVRDDAERQLAAELSRVRAQAQAEADSLRHAAAQEARRAAEEAAAHAAQVDARAARAIQAERQRADAHIARRDRIDGFVAAGDAHGWDLRKARARRLPAWTRWAAAAALVLFTGAALSSPPIRATVLRIPSALSTQLTSMTSREGAPPSATTVSTATAPPLAERPPRPGEPAAAPQPRGSGLLAVSSRIPVEVHTRGRRIGTSDGGQMVLASGTHRLELVNRRFNYRDVVSVAIEPDGLTSYSVALPTGSVHVETAPGAEIWIEGERIGAAPLGDLPVAIGTREVVVRHANRERRQPVEVRQGEVTVVTAIFEPLASPAEAAAGLPALTAPSLHIIR